MTNAQDPRCNFTLTADCSSALMELFKEAYSDKGWCPMKPDMPVLFLSGEDDPCMISREKFVRAADLMVHNGYKRVSSRTYAGMRHEILNEVDRISAWNDILDYISALK
jgi:alpha-beta hydrolase superfamily lysophospholipase